MASSDESLEPKMGHSATAQDLRILTNNPPNHPPKPGQFQKPTHPFLPPPPNLFPLRNASQRNIRFPHQGPPMAGPPPHFELPPHHQLPRLPPGLGVPPVTVLVPYPIILPLPIPIPIPLPILRPPDPIKLKTTPDENRPAETTTQPVEDSDDAQPLDYTKNFRRSPILEPCQDVENDTPSPQHSPSTSKSSENPEQKVPKFKITRLASKRNLAKEIERESSRPLRKRRCLLQTDQHQVIEVENLGKKKL